MTSTPPAWKWRDECDVPVEAPEQPVRWCKPRESATFGKQNGGGVEPEASCFTTRKLDTFPTGEDIWPLERAVSTNASGTCCAEGCESTAQMAKSQSYAAPSHRVGTCYMDPDTGETVMPADFFGEKELRWTPDKTTAPADSCSEYRHRYLPLMDGGVDMNEEPAVEMPKCPVCLHEMENDEGVLCDHCGEPTGPGSFAVVNGPGGVFVYHLRCYDEAYWGGQDDGQKPDSAEAKPLQSLVKVADRMSDIDCAPGRVVFPNWDTPTVEETFDVPFPVQSWTFEALIELEVDHLHEIIDVHHDEIVKMARRRHRTGHVLHGSKGYQWDAKTRLRNVLEELSDAPTYLTMGPIE